MQVVGGFIILLASIIGDDVSNHGQVDVLPPWSEFLIIGGAGIGAFVVSNTMPMIKGSLARLRSLLKPNPYIADVYADLLQMIDEMMQIAEAPRRTLEPHVSLIEAHHQEEGRRPGRHGQGLGREPTARTRPDARSRPRASRESAWSLSAAPLIGPR